MSDSNPFWAFSWCFYQQPGVEPFCLEMQDQQGIDVNLLLFCCWAAYAGFVLEQEQLHEIKKLADEFRIKHVEPIRQQRRLLDKADPQRQVLLEQELEAEKAQQQQMFDHFERKVSAGGYGQKHLSPVESLALNLALVPPLYPTSSVNMSQEGSPILYQALQCGDF